VTKLVGFDDRELTGHQRGKPKAIAHLRSLFPYETVVMVGDGITDLEAVQETGGADLFVGFTGVVRREAVAAAADWCVDSFAVLQAALRRHQVAMIGSGAAKGGAPAMHACMHACMQLACMQLRLACRWWLRGQARRGTALPCSAES
jgi:glycerol-3-phosphate dehydrogenase (NAD+)